MTELPTKPPNLTRHLFTCNIIFTNKFDIISKIIDDQYITYIKIQKTYYWFSSYPVRTPKVDSAGFIMADKNNGGLKYGGIAEKTAKFNSI